MLRGPYFFLSILVQVSSGTVRVVGFIGENVTLPCEYDAQTLGVLSFCWGRGTVPTFGCSDAVLSSRDGVVLSRRSPRYQLLGRPADGEASLTILEAESSDAGEYGCRVEIPGWFNDRKLDTSLVMEEAPVVQQLVKESFTWSTEVTVEVSDPRVAEIQGVKEEKFKGFLTVGNIVRMAAIFLSNVILILVIIFRRMFPLRGTLQHVDTSAAENIYEKVPPL